MPTGSSGGGGSGVPAGWPVAYFQSGAISSGAGLGSNNQVQLFGFVLNTSTIFSNITVFVGTADAVNSYDLGVYNKAGALLANIGAQTLPSTGVQTFATLQGVLTLQPGLYLFGFTGTSTTAQLFNDAAGHLWWFDAATGTPSVGGALPVSVGAQVVTIGRTSVAFALS